MWLMKVELLEIYRDLVGIPVYLLPHSCVKKLSVENPYTLQLQKGCDQSSLTSCQHCNFMVRDLKAQYSESIIISCCKTAGHFKYKWFHMFVVI